MLDIVRRSRRKAGPSGGGPAHSEAHAAYGKGITYAQDRRNHAQCCALA
jgi:hypothetical protein